MATSEGRLHDVRRRRRHLIIAVLATALVLAGMLPVLPALAAASAPTGTTLLVDDTNDQVDANVGDRVCRASGGGCTLRAAVQEANAIAGPDTIHILPGTYAIGIAPINENGANVGDFEILDPVTIEKAPDYLGTVVIDGGTPLPSAPVIARGLDRLFEIHPGAGDVTIRNVTLQNGFTPEEGGAIQNWSMGKLTLDGVTVKDSYAEKAGGGLNYADLHDYPWTTEPPNLELLPYGRVEILRSTFTGNGSAGGSGAAINNVSGGTITISQESLVTLNPGAIKPDPLDPERFVLVDPSDYPIAASAVANQARWEKAGTLKISDSTISLNATEGNGAGILNEGDSIVEITNSTLTQNRAAAGGGLYTEGGKVTVSGSTVSKNQAANGGGLYSGGQVSQHGLRGSFTVKDSQVFENIAENGGGILNGGDAQLSVTDTTFRKNHSSDHGAAIASEGRSNMTLTRVTVTENASNGEGGGVWTHSERQHTIIDSTFTKNKAGVPVVEDDGTLGDNIAGGGALHTDGGPLTVRDSTFDGNVATDEGGALSLHNAADVEIVDSTISNNRALDGGGLENSATEVTFQRVTVSGNRAQGAGGGIFNTSSGEFHLLDSTIRGNSGQMGGGLANAPDQAIIVRGSLFLNNTAHMGTTGEDGELPEEAGQGGGIMSFADGDSLYENTTISGNKAASAGGGVFHDADGELRLTQVTIWRNSAPSGGGIGVRESDFVPPVPPAANSAVILKNSIVGGSLNGGSCDWYVRSEGGNLETGATNTCFLAVTHETAESPIELGVRDRRGDPRLLAIADNGGPTLTHALQHGSLAIDSSAPPCSTVDQRGIERPQNGRCDAGAFEFEGEPPPSDVEPPETVFDYPEDGPFQDGIETMAFRFRGTDNVTAPEDLNFECRFLEIDLAEEPDPVAPWDPVPPELRWNGCSSPWSVPLPEEGQFRFEVRAIDRADNVDPTPVSQLISGVGMTPPDTVIVEAPGLTPGRTVPPAPATTPSTNSRSALFSFMAVSDFTPSQFAEYECRLDSRDPEMWVECFNPTMFSDLTTGLHTFEVRALAGEAAGPDPTPARYTWRVGPDPDDPGATPISCDEANITLTPNADGWADQVTPLENYWSMTELEVRSGATDPGNGQPVVPENARAFFRFPLQSDAPDCELVSATLRLYSGSNTEGRTLAAVPLAETWKESTLTWTNQPDPVAGAAIAQTSAGEGYREFDVKAHVEAIFAGTLPSQGWVIRDGNESDLEGGDQSFLSRETPQDPPEVTLPELELRFEAADTPPPPDREEPGAPEVVTCGQIITESTKLAADVTGCLGQGIAIGAPNIVLDLNGHTVSSGLVLEPGEEDNLTPGIRSGYPNVEIRNGTVTNFGYGVLLGPGSVHSEVHGMTLVRNALTGVQLFDADNGRLGSTVHDNVFDSNGETGLQLMSGTEGALIENNHFVSNGMSIHVFDSHRNVIRGNTISGIILDPALDSDAGIVLENGSRQNVLENNDVSDTGDAGIKIHQGSHGNIVRGGVLVRNGDAGVIVQDADRIEIDGVLAHQQSDGGVVLSNSSNSVVKNSELGYNPSGVDAARTNYLVVENNDVSHSLQAGIALGDGVGMVIRGNIANNNGGPGISVDGAAFDASGVAVGGALIEGNTAHENAASGISVAVGKHTIRNNTANLNANYGIEAGEDTASGEPPDPNRNIDGGGNKAAGNHSDGVTPGLPDAVQCVGVVCETGDLGEITPPDLQAPQTILTSTPPALTGNETARFEFTADDGADGDPLTALTFECRLDAPPDPSVPPEEPDLEPPDPNEPPELPEPPEGERWGECSSPQTYLSLEPAMDHHFEVRAIDQAGNFDPTPAEFTWRIEAGVEEDGTEECGPGETLGVDCTVAGATPDTRITAAPGELITDAAGTRYDTTNRAASFTFTGNDNRTAGYNLTYECRTYYDQFNDHLTPADIPATAEWGSCESPKQYSNLAHGGHIFQVRAVDLVGNKDLSPASHTWWIHPPPPDTTPPDTQFRSGPDPTTVQTSATFTFTGSDNQTPAEELEFQCRLDGAMDAGQPAWTTCTSPHTVNGLTPAEHVLQVRAVDLAGNVDDVNGNVDDPSAPDVNDPGDGVPAAYVWSVGDAPVPKTVFCGQKITHSIKVNNNLGDCLGHGLIVGADGITIDLNGRTIDGKSLGAAILNNGYDSVTIKNGRLTDFDYGVMLNNGARLNIVEGVTADVNQEAAIGLGHGTFPEDPTLAPSEPVPGFQSGVDGNILRSNTLVSNTRGVWLLNGAKDNVVRGNLIGSTSGEAVWIERAGSNLIEGNDIQVASKAGILLEGATDNTIKENSIVEAGTGVIVRATTSGATGIESTGNLVQGNLVTESSGPALEIDTSSSNQLIDNVGQLTDSYAIELYRANDNLVRGNDVSGNKGGISLKESTGNLIKDNDASDSDSTGITLESHSYSNTLLNNVSSGNNAGGIYIGDEAPSGQGTLVQGNTANSNKGTGIQATKPSHIFKDNVAMDNDSWGIWVGDPSNGKANIDGGGNVAQSNDGPLGVDLKPQQCYNITCLGGPGGGDQIAPNTSILETPLDPSTESVAVFRFTGADNASPVTFECRFESTLESAWQPCSSPKTYDNLVNDTYTFEVRAVDFSGNVDPTPASYTWAVQLGTFTVSIDSTPDKVTVDTTATFEFSANRQSGVTFQCLRVPAGTDLSDLWDTAPRCSSPTTYTDLEPGQYEFWVRATDAASTYNTKMYAWTVGPSPVASRLTCGEILTQSTRLLNDLVDCGGHGLIVGAPGITIDLDGHVVDGLGLDAGILNNGHDDVTITNGLVTQFLNGVQLNPGTARNVVHALRVEGNEEAGIALSDADQGADGNTIRDNSIVANEIGIALYTGTRHAVIRGNTLAANRGEGAILLEFASENLIEGNQIGQSAASGVSMLGGGSNTVTENVLKDNGGIGIMAGDDLLASDDNRVQRNTIRGGQGGVMVAGDGNTVLNNDVIGTTGPGVMVELATNTLVKGNDLSGSAGGIVVGEATGTIVEANNASGTLGSGIEIGELSLDSVVRDNTTSGNGGDGIEITESSVIDRGTLVESNTADANGGDGILVEGAGHTIRTNVAQLNGGWGIYSVGAADGGGNLAAGNAEPDQCFGVVCELGVVPGAPDTWIVSGPADWDTSTPGIQSASRNASFTYMGADESSPITELVFECRMDSTNALAWEDCEYPAEYLNLSPGEHTLDIRAVDMMGQGLADPTPASFTWTYVPLPTGVAPEVAVDVGPEDTEPAVAGVQTWLLDAVFTFHANEPDVTFQCKVDTNAYEPCGFESATLMSQGAFEWALAENEVGPHTFSVRAIDFEGNVGAPTTFTWELLGVNVVFTDGPGFTPATGGPEGTPATGGPTASTSAEITFEANVADAQFWCRFDSVDPGDYFPCDSPFRAGPAFAADTTFPEPLLPGDHILEVYAESETMASAAELEPAVYEWEVVDAVDTLPPQTSIERAPGAADLSSTIFEFSGTDDLTPEFLLTFECQVTNGTAAPNDNEWVQCTSPFNLLDVYSYTDPELLLTEHTFYVRAVDMFEPEFPDPTQPEFEGNPDPTPASYTWTPVADTRKPVVTVTGGPADGATVGQEPELYTFAGNDNATPQLRLEFECAAYLTTAGIGSAEWQSCESPAGGGYDISGLEPGAYTVAVRATDLAGNVGPAATRTVTVSAAPVVTFLSGPDGRLDPTSGQPDGASGTENAVFTFESDQSGSTFECSVDGSDFLPCGGTTVPASGAAWVVDNGEHAFVVRATNPQGIVGEEAVYEWLVQLGPDATEPNSQFATGPQNGTLNTVATFTFTGTDNRTPTRDLNFECALDSTTSWNSCTSPEQFSDLTRGAHTLRLRAIDAAGNIESTPAVYTWTVAPPPVVTILSGPGVEQEESTDRTATFTFSSDVSPVTFHCWLDGAFDPHAPGDPSQPAPCDPAGQTYADLGIGEHLFAVRAVDQFGNIGQWEDSEFRVTPSEARMLSAPASGTSTTATFEFTSEPSDPDAVFYCSLDDRPFSLCTGTPVEGSPGTYSKTYTNLWAGEHTFQVQTLYTGTDWRGLPFEHHPVPAVHTWTVQDLTAPDTTIDFGPPATTMSTSAYLQVSSDDPSATIECTLTGPAGTQQADCEPGVVTELTDLAPGAYTFTAVATDLSGNADTSPATHEWTIGTPDGPPNTPAGENVEVTLGDVTVTYFSVGTAGTTTAERLGGGPSLPEGYGGARYYDISTTAEYSEPVTICIDYDPADFGGTKSLRLLHFDGSEWMDITTLHNPFSTPARLCSSEAGGFSVFAIATASSGMAPETFILSGPDGPPGPEGRPSTTSGSATFEFWTDQENAITQCSLDGDPYFFCESPLTVGPLEEGGHELLVQAVNEFGWVDLTPAIYEFEVIGPDVTPPTTVITNGPREGSSTPNFISFFEFGGTDDMTPALDLEFECTLDGEAIGGCETPQEIEVFTPGEHTLVVQAIDAAGNVDPVGATRTWTVVDMSGPDTAILTGPEEETTETSATFTFEGFELIDGPNGPIPVTEFECALDQGEFAPCTSPHEIAGPLGGGVHVLHVRAVDPDGNRDISPAFYEWLILGSDDTTPPDTFITTYPDPANSGPDVTFGFASNEPVETFECSWGSGAPPAEPTTWEQCEAVWLLEALGSGQHWLWVRALDSAPTPNVDPTPAGRDRGFGPNDTAPFVWTTTGEPDTIVDSGPADPTGSSTAIFEFHSDQPGATFQCSVNGSSWVGCSSGFQAGPFLPGPGGAPMEHEFQVRAVNQYRNANGEQVMDLSPATHTWTVQDVTPPETQFLGAQEIGPEQFLEPGLRFTFRGDDDQGSSYELTFECAITNTTAGDPVVWESCGEPAANDSFFHDIVYADLTGGAYTFQVRALDLAANADETPAPLAPYEFTVEGEPETTIGTVTPDMGVDLETTSTSVTFTFSGTGASFRCALDSTVFEPCTSPKEYTDVPYGEHEFRVFAVGEFGTPDLSPAVFEWVSGTDVAPDVTITSGPPATGSTATSGTIEFSSADPQASFLCVLDGGPERPCSSPFEYADLLAGEQNPHTFEVTATRTDLLPSVTLNTATHEWVINDEAAPETVLLATPSSPSGNEVEFRFTGSDNGTVPANLEFECRLDGVDPWAGCSSPHTIADLTGGEHTFEVRAVDETLQADPEPASYSWDVIAPPLTTITNEAPAGVDVPDGDISISATGELSFADQPGSTYECRLDAVDTDVDLFTPCESPYSYDLSNGEHVFEVRATTLPLNGQRMTESPAARYTWTVDAADTTAPDTTIQLGPANPATSTSATFLFSGTDNLTAAGNLTFECSLDGSDFAGCQSGDAYTGLTGGPHTFAVRASDTAVPPNVDDSPATFEWTIEAPGADNTPVGTEVEVTADGARITFAEVTGAGFTAVSALTAGSAPGLPAGYDAAGARYYDVSTTATFVGAVTVCLPYDTLVDAHVLHFDGVWVDVTLEEQGDLVCGVVSSLSPFAVAEASAEVAPDTTIVQAPADPTVQSTGDGADVRFQFSSTIDTIERPAQFECRLDAEPWSSCDTPFQFNALFGEHTLRVRAWTDTGVRDATPAVYTWTVLARPVATIQSGPADQNPSTPDVENESRSAEFVFSSDQSSSTFECRLTGEATGTTWETCSSPKSYENLGLGEYTFEVQAIKDGNASFVPAQYEWEVADLSAPTVTIDSGPEGTVDSTSANFTFSASEPSTFECSLDGAPFGMCQSGVTYTGLGLGEHTFDVRADDLSEGENPSEPVRRSWTVADLTAPNITIGEQPAATTSDTTAQFSFTTSDNWGGAVTTECRLDGAAFAACASPTSYSGLSAAQHTFDVRATDSAGNARTESYSWTVQDVVDPEAQITSVTTGSLVIEFTGTDDHTAPADLRFECRVDSEAYSVCTSPRTYSDVDLAAMTPGDHTFQVRAMDEAGNVGQPDSRTFTVPDTKAPDTSITGRPAATTTNTTATFTFTGSDDGTAPASLTFECSLDDAAFAACTSGKEYTGLAVGGHTFQVRAKDAAGNTDQSPASYSWEIQETAPTPDTTAPETTISANPPATTTETNASFSFAGTDNETPAGDLTFECKLDTGTYAACTTPKAYTGLAIGTHTFSVRAKDAAGNVDQTPTTYSWTIQNSTVNCGSQQTLTATADAWIDEGSATSNKGPDAILKVMSKSGANLRALLRFDLPTMPQGCSVESATLRIYAKSAAGGRTLQVFQLGASWTEGGVTWANQPSTTGSAATTSSGTGYREWNVAGMVQAMYTSANHGFLVRDANESQDAEQQFHSREESTNRPQLVLTFGTTAPPNGVPDTQITGSPLAATSSSSATFTFTGTDDATPASGLTFECQLDGAGTWTACASPQSYSNLAAGSHTFRVRATDGSGAVDPQPAAYTWTIDQTAPETVLSSGPDSSTTSTSATFRFLSPESGATFECSLDSAPYAACSSPRDYTGLTAGQHTFRVRAADAAGNVDQTPVSYSWTIQPGGTPPACGSAQTMTSVADAWIDQSSASSNKGGDSILKLMSKSGNANLRALVRFDLPAIPAGCVLDTAKLRLYAASTSGTQRTLQVFRLGGSWTENGVTWANAPQTSGSAATTTSGSGYREWNVATLVQAMYSSGSNHGFLIKDATEGQDAEQQFHAREKGDNVPQLVLTFKPAS
ncbi:right-handed parallel beta-helix repeat-containing protein [Jiangella aurantiaca]|uniref:right-handed parallel beta-helix repeat-containing protein n=1 Tax=Jiangella aurantiaca TaxID=2530373 RepID=UPI0013A5BFC8|nr:right-handed parallel beta-helix repeat-containing protein [Jiangella aurantiaca]